MFKIGKDALPHHREDVNPFKLRGVINFADEGGGGDKGGKGGEGSGDKDPVSKEDFEAMKTENAKLKDDLEDIRLEVVSPEYMEWVNSKKGGGDEGDKGGDKGGSDKVFGDLTEDAIEKMSKKDLLLKAVDIAKGGFKKDIEGLTSSSKKDAEARREREIGVFKRSHEDFETFRPIMYGISLDPKNRDYTLQELYDASKAYIGRIHREPTKEEKEKQARLQNEKPEGASESVEELAKLSADEAADKAMDEVREKLGPIPTA